MGSPASAQTAGAFLVDRGVVTPEQLEEALELQRAHGGDLHEILVGRFGIDRSELDRNGAETPIGDVGEILLEWGMVEPEQLEAARAQHAVTGKPIGPTLVELGAITRMELASALAVQWKDRPARILPSPNGRDRGHTGFEAPRANGDVEDLRFAIRALEASVRSTRADDGSEALGELSARAQAFEEHLRTISARVDVISSNSEHASAEVVAELDERVASLALGTAGGIQALETAVAELRVTLAELEQHSDADPGLADQVGELAHQVRAIAAESIRPLDGEVSAVAERVEAMGGNLAELRAAFASLADRHAVEHELDELALRIDELARGVEGHAATTLERIGRLEGVVAAPSSTTDALRTEVAALAATVTELGSMLPRELERLSKLWGAERDALGGRIDVLSEPAAAARVGAPPSSTELDGLAKQVERLGDRVVEQERSLVEHFSRREKAMLERLGIGGGDLSRRVDQLARVFDEQRQLLQRLVASPADELVARVDQLAQLVESLASAKHAAPLREAGTSGSYLALIPTGAGYQLVELDGPTPAAGHRIASPIDDGELLVRGVGTSPFPGDERACIVVEPVSVSTPA